MLPTFVSTPRVLDEGRNFGEPLTPRTIPGSTIAALRELLVRMYHDEAEAGEEGAARAGAEVRHALVDVCEDARAHGVRVEQIVIAIKQGWSDLHGDHPRTRTAGPDGLLNHVITVCIDEYYAREGSK